jgi:hypothetical protein
VLLRLGDDFCPIARTRGELFGQLVPTCRVRFYLGLQQRL